MRGGARMQNKTSGGSSQNAMNFKGTVDCFRFAFGFLAVVLPENFLARVTCIKILEKPPGEWNELASEELPSKSAELNALGPFESVDDSLYKSRLFLNVMQGRNALEKIFEDDSRKMLREKADEQATRFSDREEIINRRLYQMNAFKQAQTRNRFLTQDDTFPSTLYKTIRNDISKIKLQVKKLKRIFCPASNLPEVENSPLECLEKLIERIKQETRGESNKMTINNRFQINGIFLINGISNEDTRNKPDAELAPLTEVLNNLKEKPDQPHSSADHQATFQLTEKPYDLKLIKEMQENFSKMFRNQDVTLELINKMYKIVDFVERYHGFVGNLKGLDLNEEEVMRTIEETVAELPRRVRT